MMESELGDEEVHVTLLSVRGRLKAVRFVTRLGQREILEFTEDEQKDSWGGKPSEVQRKKIEAVISQLKQAMLKPQ